MSVDNRINVVEEGSRILTICNACRYCEGHCAVFPALQRRLVFDADSIDYLANLCHQCGACYHHCQYADPHEFDVNVPKVLGLARHNSYASFVRPAFMSTALRHGGWFSALVLIIFTVAFIAGALWTKGSQALFVSYPLGFYTFMPHEVMASIFVAAAILVVAAGSASIIACWRSLSLGSPTAIPLSVYRGAITAAFSLKHLGGGHEEGCYETGEAPSTKRRWFHHLTLYGFVLCFAATTVGTIYHYGFNLPAPYGWLSLPKLLGTVGGIAVVIGCSGLLVVKQGVTRNIAVHDNGLGTGFTVLLLLTCLTGLLLPILKHSPMLALLLCIHLASVLALFVLFAWGKFMHGFYRLIALIKDATEAQVKPWPLR